MDIFSPDQKVAVPLTPSAPAVMSTTGAFPSSGTARKRLLLKDEDVIAEIAFMCDVMTINGDMEKTWDSRRREYVYRLSQSIKW